MENLHKQIILVVDDLPANIDILSAILKRRYLVKAATSGQKALEIAMSPTPPDLILLDVMMPDLDGFEVCRRLKQNPLTRGIPVIFVTARDEDEATGFACGGVDYICKPVSAPTVEARVRTHLALYDQNRALEDELGARTAELMSQHEELSAAYSELKQTHEQLIRQEKMASIGQLAAGVAHEINNPTGFILSNLASLAKYLERLLDFVNAHSVAAGKLEAAEQERLAAFRTHLKIDRIITDVPDLVNETRDGAERIRRIAQSLKAFSRKENAEYTMGNIVDCLESTINIVWNEIKYKATLKKKYMDLPPIKCYPQLLSQVFMNLIVNAAHAIEEGGEIEIKTWQETDNLYVAVSDNGSGIPAEVQDRIFEPFFTTKPAGLGTGLGLSISHEIVRKHGGEIRVESAVGKGTTFTIILPMNGVEPEGSDEVGSESPVPFCTE